MEALYRKTFLKGMLMLDPGRIVNGPWGLGSRQVPLRGKTYCPPSMEDSLSRVVASPR